MQEDELYGYWLMHARSGAHLDDGRHRLRILKAGTLNRHQGPDFVNCRFELDGVMYQGSVELHSDSAGWYAHRHHLDPAFRDVALHVVGPDAADHRDVQHQQRDMPIVTFCLPRPAVLLPAQCPLTGIPADPDILWELASRRLEEKIRYFSHSNQSAQSLFGRGMFHVAGYPHNSAVFDLLFAELDRRPVPTGISAFARLALYAGTAGFLPVFRPDGYARLLNATFEKYFPRIALAPGLWHLGGCRPGNHPHFRLAALAALFEKDVYGAIHALLSNRLPPVAALNGLKAIFDIPVSRYWATHDALGRSTKRSRRRYWGNARVTEIIMNLILPLEIARARQRGSLGYESYLTALYRLVPAAAAYGRFEKRYSWYRPFIRRYSYHGLGQGVLALEKQFCLRGACAACPLVSSASLKAAG